MEEKPESVFNYFDRKYETLYQFSYLILFSRKKKIFAFINIAIYIILSCKHNNFPDDSFLKKYQFNQSQCN